MATHSASFDRNDAKNLLPNGLTREEFDRQIAAVQEECARGEAMHALKVQARAREIRAEWTAKAPKGRVLSEELIAERHAEDERG